MNIKISYYIIMTIDIYTKSTKLLSIKPAFLKKDFRVTESVPDDDFTVKHRKYIGTVSAKKLKNIVDELENLDICETMGSLTEMGWLPAVSWDYNEDSEYRMNLYVSPIIENQDELIEELDSLDENNKRIKVRSISNKIDIAMENLKEANDIESFMDSFQIDLNQMELYFEELEEKKHG